MCSKTDIEQQKKISALLIKIYPAERGGRQAKSRFILYHVLQGLATSHSHIKRVFYVLLYRTKYLCSFDIHYCTKNINGIWEGLSTKEHAQHPII